MFSMKSNVYNVHRDWLQRIRLNLAEVDNTMGL